MLETPHVAVGAAIASKIPNPLISIPLAFASHFVLEFVPHWNPHLNTEKNTYGKITKKSTQIVIFDVLLSLCIGGFFAYRAYPNISHSVTILLASFASVLPDVVEGPYFFLNKGGKKINKWIKFQKSIQVDAPVITGLATQVIVLLSTFWWVLN